MLVLYSIFVLAQNETTGKTLYKRCIPEHCPQKFCIWCQGLNQVDIQSCRSTRNGKCECKEGFYLNISDSYRPHMVCPRGYRIGGKGTSDMLCERCQKGLYADGQQGCQLCIPKTKCKSDEKLLFSGNYYLDNVCVTCSSIIHDGWVKFIIQPFIEIFKNHNTQKLQHFIGNLTNSLDNFPSNQDSCFQKLEQWFSKATEKEVISLPNRLKTFNIKSLKLITKIKKRLKTIQNKVKGCRNKLLDHK
ncbi:uncharacterized protein LOC132857434 isoform X2 [Tachysurus vachellii]|nr:uncharacterized protein LOC132857434 isoform X2 [Tachysurus vachellii]